MIPNAEQQKYTAEQKLEVTEKADELFLPNRSIVKDTRRTHQDMQHCLSMLHYQFQNISKIDNAGPRGAAHIYSKASRNRIT